MRTLLLFHIYLLYQHLAGNKCNLLANVKLFCTAAQQQRYRRMRQCKKVICTFGQTEECNSESWSVLDEMFILWKTKHLILVWITPLKSCSCRRLHEWKWRENWLKYFSVIRCWCLELSEIKAEQSPCISQKRWTLLETWCEKFVFVYPFFGVHLTS